jgi:hypothetical protein
MGDIKVLLREAVPVDEAEPDLAAVADRVRRRRTRRRAARGLGATAVAVALAGGVVVAGQDTGRDDRGNDVATAPTGRPDDAGQPRSRAETSDASAFARLLATRDWLTAADIPWPVRPSDFLAGPPEPGQIVTGTLTEVRSGPVTTSPVGEPECADQRCRAPQPETNLEMVIRVDLVLPGDQAHPDEVVVPWVTAVGEVDERMSDELAAPFEEVAPIGARVLVYLRPSDGDPYDYRAEEPSGIVIEDGEGVAVPQPEAAAPDLGLSFDEYLAELDHLFTERMLSES